MLEAIASTVLSRLLGAYVKDLNTERLKFSLGSGTATLENLELRPEALEEFDLPITIKAGFLGKVQLEVPWKNLKSQPTTVIIDGVLLIAGSTSENGDLSGEAAERRAWSTKKRRLQLAKLLTPLLTSDDEEHKKETRGNEEGGFVEQIRVTVFNNIQIYINNVHIRFEDTRRALCAGITLEHLHAQTTDNNWQPAFLKGNLDSVYKLITMRNMSVYWNSGVSALRMWTKEHGVESSKGLTFLKNMIFSQDNCVEPIQCLDYIIAPTSASLKVQLNNNITNENGNSLPKHIVDFVFENIALNLNDAQWSDLVSLVDHLAHFQKYLHYRRFRNSPRMGESLARGRWRFAIRAILGDLHEKSLVERYESEYIELYVAQEKKSKAFTAEKATRIEELEKALPYDAVIRFRAMGEAYLQKEKKKKKEKEEAKAKEKQQQPPELQQPKSGGWFGGWVGGWIAKDTSTLVAVGTSDMDVITAEILKELRSAIAEEEAASSAANPRNIPRDYIKTLVQFGVKQGSLSLHDKKKCLTKGNFSNLSVSAAVRIDSFSMKLTLEAIDVFDFEVPNPKYQRLLMAANPTEETKFWTLSFDYKPLSMPGVEYALGMKMQPLNIIYSRHLFKRLISMFRKPLKKRKALLRSLELATFREFKSLGYVTQNYVTELLAAQKLFHVDIELQAPNVIFPKDFKSNTELVLQLGTVGMKSVPTPKEDRFHRITLSVHSLQATLEASKGNGIQRSRRNLFERFDVNFDISMLKIDLQEGEPKVRVKGSLPKLNGNISADTLGHLWSIADDVSTLLDDDNSEGSQSYASFSSSTSAMSLTTPSSVWNNDPDDSSEDLLDSISIFSLAALQNFEKNKMKELEGTKKLLDAIVQVEFGIPEVAITYFDDLHKEREIILLSLQELALSFTHFHDTDAASLRLKSFQIEDKVQKWAPENQFMVTSQLSEQAIVNRDLISISYKSQRIPSKASLQHLVECNFHVLRVVVNPETLLVFISDFDRVAVELSRSHSRKPSARPSTIEKERLSHHEPNLGSKVLPDEFRALSSTSNQTGAADIIVVARMESISLVLNREGAPLLSGKFVNMALALEKFEGSFEITGQLGGLKASSGDPEILSHFPDLIEVQPNTKLIEFAYRTFEAPRYRDPKYRRPNEVPFNAELSLTVTSVRCIYVQKFITQFFSYLHEFEVATRLLRQTAAMAAELAQKSDTYIAISFTICNPFVVVPRDMSSTEGLTLDLGRIVMSNIYRLDNDVLLNDVTVSVFSLNVVTGTLPQHSQLTSSQSTPLGTRSLIGNTDVEITITRPTNDFEHKFAELLVNAKIGEVHVTLSESQLTLLLDLVKENVCSTPWPYYHENPAPRVPNPDGSTLGNAEMKIWTDIHITADLDRFLLDIIMDDGTGMDVDYVSFTLWKGEHFTASLAFLTDETIFGEFYLDVLTMHDRRKGHHNAFEKFFARREDPTTSEPTHEKKKQQVVIQYRKATALEHNVCILLDKLYLVMIPDVFLPLYHYVLCLIRDVVGVVSVFQEWWHGVVPIAGNTFSLRISLEDPELWFLEDCSKKDSNAVIIRSLLDLIYKDTSSGSHFALIGKHTQIYTGKLPCSPATAAWIMEPFGVQIDWDMSTGSDLITFSLEQTPLRIIFTVQDYLVTSVVVIEWWYAIIRHLISPPLSYSKISEKVKFLRKSQKITERPMSAQQSTTTTEASTTIVTPGAAKSTQLFEFKMRELHLTLINDYNNQVTPLIHCYVTKTGFTLSGWSSMKHMKATLVATSTVDYYNGNLETWEPLVEEISFACNFAETQASFLTLNPVNINVTKAFIETFVATADVLSAVSKQKAVVNSAARRTVMSHVYYFIRNTTELPIWYWPSNSQEKFLVAPGAEEAMSSIKRSLNSKLSHKPQPKISLQIGGFRPLYNIPVDRSGTFVLFLTSDRSGPIACLEIGFRTGCKLLTVRSKVLIENLTTIAFDFKFTTPNTHSSALESQRSPLTPTLNLSAVSSSSSGSSSTSTRGTISTSPRGTTSTSPRSASSLPAVAPPTPVRASLSQAQTNVPIPNRRTSILPDTTTPADNAPPVPIHRLSQSQRQPSVKQDHLTMPGTTSFQPKSIPPLSASQPTASLAAQSSITLLGSSTSNFATIGGNSSALNYNYGSVVEDVEPGKKSFVPLNDALFMEHIRLRPTKMSTDWSTPLEVTALKTKFQRLVCPVAEVPLYFNVFINSCKNLDKVITVTVPLTIENLLPHDLNYQIYDGRSKQKMHEGRVQVQKEEPVVTIPPDFVWGLRITVPEAGYSSWSPLMPINLSPLKERDIIPLIDASGQTLELEIRSSWSQGALKVIILAPYWVVNKTKLPLIVRGSRLAQEVAAGQIEQRKKMKTIAYAGDPLVWHNSCNYEQLAKPLMYSSKQLLDLRSDRVAVKIASSDWSKSFDIETKGKNFIQMGEENGGRRFYQLLVNITDGPGKFWRTNVVTIRPLFVLTNLLPEKIFYKQVGMLDKECYVLPPNSELPFYWPDRDLPMRLTMKLNGTDWSSGFSMNFGTIWIKMRELRSSNVRYVRTNIKFAGDEAGTSVLFLPQDVSLLPYRIENQLPVPISISQKGTRFLDIIPPLETMPYTWDDPAVRPLEISISIGATEVFLGLEKLKNYPGFEVRGCPTLKRAWVNLVAEGPIRVLQVMDRGAFYGSDDWTLVDEDIYNPRVPTLQVILSFETIGISVVDDTPQELLFMMLKNVQLEYDSNKEDQQLEIKVESVQIDNQMNKAVYPIAIYHRPPPKGSPFFNFKIAKVNDAQSTSIDHFRFLSLLMHELYVKVDELLLLQLARFGFVLNDFWKNHVSSRLQASGLTSSHSGESLGMTSVRLKEEAIPSKMVYFELLLINPTRLTLSFSNNGSVSSVRGELIDETFNNIMSKGIFNVDSAPIEIRGLSLEHPFTTRRDLLNRLIQQYKENGYNEFHKLVGAADIIGSPISLFESLGAGWHDFFHEPAQGAMISYEDLGKGLVKGTKSLVNNSVSGMMNSTSKVTGTIGQGLSALLDKDYSSQHLQKSLVSKPKTGVEGIATGLGDLAEGVFSGFSGLIMDPIKGASTGGASGFFKGVAKGLTGVAVKPIVGTLDLVSKTSEGIKNRREESINAASGAAPLKRMRLPRTFGEDKTLKPYSERHAVNQSLLASLENGAFAFQHFMHRIDLSNHDILMLTSSSLILVHPVNPSVPSSTSSSSQASRTIRPGDATSQLEATAPLGQFQTSWVVGIADIRGLQVQPHGILLLVRRGAGDPEIRFIYESTLVKKVYRELLGQLKQLKEASNYFVCL